MGDKSAIAALGFAMATLVILLFTPVAAAPKRDAVLEAERIVSATNSQELVLRKDQTKLVNLGARVGVLRKQFEGTGGDDLEETRRRVRELVAQELDRRWPEVEQRLKIIMQYRTRPTR